MIAELENNPRSEDLKRIDQGLAAFGESRSEPRNSELLTVLLRDEQGQAHGGLRAVTVWRWLEIKMVFVPEELRGRGHGRRLVAIAEREALRRGCLAAWLDTFSFHAAQPFYERLGYEPFGALEEFPPGHRRVFMRKRLQ